MDGRTRFCDKWQMTTQSVQAGPSGKAATVTRRVGPSRGASRDRTETPRQKASFTFMLYLPSHFSWEGTPWIVTKSLLQWGGMPGRLQEWFQWVQAPAPGALPKWLEVLRGFPEACREALHRDPGSLEAWAGWLDSSGVDTFLGSVVSDAWVRTWQKAWLRVWVEAARRLLVSASWTDRTFPRGLPQDLHEFYRQRFPDLPDFSWEGFWEDLVQCPLGTRTSVRRRAGSVFPVVFRGESVLPVRYEAGVLEGWDRGEVFPDPMQVLVRPMKEDFLGAMKEAAEAAGLRESVRVRVVPVNPHGENNLVLWGLEGPSGGGALYVALRSLRGGLVPDSRLAITFAVRGGEPQPVGELDVKARGCARSGLSELMVAEDYTPPSDVGLSVVRIRDLGEAEVHALGLARGVRAYLEGLRERLDRTPWRDPEGRLIAVTRIAVPIRVLKKVIRARVRREAGEAEPPEPVARPRRPVDPEVARYYEEPVEYEESRESVLWEREMGQVRRGVILGAPGGGKTFLTQWTALRLAEESLKGLDEGTPLEDLPLPVHVELPRLAKHLGGAPEEALGACLAEAFPAEGREAALRRVLDLLRDRDKGWLLLDAWDQVPEGERGALREWLRAVEGWRCRVVLTCRTARYDRQELPWREAPEYELEPLGEEGIRQLFERWFGDGRGRSLWEAVRGNPSLVEACRSPLVASLTCLVHQEGGLRSGFRRGDLYDGALRLLLRRGWGRLGRGGSNVDLARRLGVLREAAWELFRVRPEVNDFGQSEAEEAIRGALESLRYGRLDVDELMGEWLEAGIVLEAGWERGEMRLAFLHRSFVEYLAGLALARRLERDWDKWADFVDRKAWHPAWREALVFTGWALKEEVLKRLVDLLADSKRDDHFRHRLGLALRILAERA
jgi:hypothetical protein